MFEFTDFLIVELTYDCNLKCSYCYLCYDKFNDKRRMSFETFKCFVDSLAEKRLINKKDKEIIVVLHGGEPLLLGAELLEKMISYFKEKFDANNLKYNLTMQTNGLLIDESFIPVLKKLNSLGVSFDGMGEAFDMRSSNDAIKNKLISSIDLLKKNNINFGLVSVLSKQNIDKLDEIYSISGTRTKLIQVYDIKDGSLDLEPNEFFEKIMKKDLENLSYINGSISAITLDRIFKRVFVDLLFEHSDACQSTCGFKFCGAGMRIVAVQPDGSIHRCDRWTINNDTKKHMFLAEQDSYDFVGINQLKNAVAWNVLLHNINKETGCDSCYARYACESDCQALHYSRYKEFGINKAKTCTQIKSLYRYIEENMLFIINNFIDNDKPFIFEEDFIYKLLFRRDILLQQNNIQCKIEYKNDERKTYIYFRRLSND